MALHRLRHRLTSVAATGVLAAVAAVALVACTPGAGPDSAPDSSTGPATPPPAGPPADPDPDPGPDPEPSGAGGLILGTDFGGPEGAADPGVAAALEAFEAWLRASRKPDAARACALMSAGLIEQMLAEATFSGLPVNTCEELIQFTAEVYRAFRSSARAQVQVVEATPTEVTLFVTYVDAGACGTVVLGEPATGWILTEQTEECIGH